MEELVPLQQFTLQQSWST
ncbi:unnamed protein product [Linum tenue]|uniref:Uncharacterized protein n=1 Tax=Linum tenue TaxID=586396 RepID=A0AAV0MDQ8_9ROSI|nr:unnamed protein product [Linum tenue]